MIYGQPRRGLGCRIRSPLIYYVTRQKPRPLPFRARRSSRCWLRRPSIERDAATGIEGVLIAMIDIVFVGAIRAKVQRNEVIVFGNGILRRRSRCGVDLCLSDELNNIGSLRTVLVYGRQRGVRVGVRPLGRYHDGARLIHLPALGRNLIRVIFVHFLAATVGEVLDRSETGRRVRHARQTLRSLLAVVEGTHDWPIVRRVLARIAAIVSVVWPVTPRRGPIRIWIAPLLRRESWRRIFRPKREVPAITVCEAMPISNGTWPRVSGSVVGRLGRHSESKGRALPLTSIAILPSRGRGRRFSRVPMWRVRKRVLRPLGRSLAGWASFGSRRVFRPRGPFGSRHDFPDGRRSSGILDESLVRESVDRRVDRRYYGLTMYLNLALTTHSTRSRYYVQGGKCNQRPRGGGRRTLDESRVGAIFSQEGFNFCATAENAPGNARLCDRFV